MRGFPRCKCAFDILARSDNTHASKFTRVYKELRFGDSRSWDTPVFVTTLVLVTRLGLVPAIGGFVPSQQSSPYRVPGLCAPQRGRRHVRAYVVSNAGVSHADHRPGGFVPSQSRSTPPHPSSGRVPRTRGRRHDRTHVVSYAGVESRRSPTGRLCAVTAYTTSSVIGLCALHERPSARSSTRGEPSLRIVASVKR